MQIIKKPNLRRRTIGFMALVLFGFFVLGFNLDMSFSSQAPEGNWSEPWYNDCEEVSIVMVDSFYNNRILTSAVAKREILRIIDLKENAYGFSLDENADKIVDIVNNFLNWNARIAEAPTIEQIKNEIDNGHPVIMPTDGRKLNNRYYTTNEYHVFVISGYDDAQKMFIVQDAGTYRGHDYQYSYAVIENAMHDYDPAALEKGRRVAIFTSPEVKKIDEPVIKTSPVPIVTPNITPAVTPVATLSITPAMTGEIKNDILPAVPQGSAENGGILKTIGDWWSRFVEWIKSIF
jgi:uncharacterized protein YvpB